MGYEMHTPHLIPRKNWLFADAPDLDLHPGGIETLHSGIAPP
jgi:hypothetical protein